MQQFVTEICFCVRPLFNHLSIRSRRCTFGEMSNALIKNGGKLSIGVKQYGFERFDALSADVGHSMHQLSVHL